MRLEVSFAELHTPLFLSGTNLGVKLDPTKRQGLKMTYDRAEKELIVEFNGGVSIVPSSNAANLTLADPTQIGIESSKTKAKPVTQTSHPMKANLKGAQVSTPQDHVFKT